MRNKTINTILIGIVAIVVVGAVGFYGLKAYTKSFSPEVTDQYQLNGEQILEVRYCSPSKKGREIFGEVVPYLMPDDAAAGSPTGQVAQAVWRTGANEATVLHIGKPVRFGGKDLAPGDYSLWTRPGKSQWQIILNSQTGQWGTAHDPAKDLLTVTVPSDKLKDVQENFTITFQGEGDLINLVLAWDYTKVTVPIEVKN